MKAISIGKRYEIHEDSLKAYDKLPVNTYTCLLYTSRCV